MATSVKLCQAEDNGKCPNEARASCFHCSGDLCLDHLTQHAKLIDAVTHSCLDDYSTILTNVSSRLQSLTISSNILNEPYVKVEQWRIDAYHQIDEIVEKKFQEIRAKIDEYRQAFDTIRNEQLEKIVHYKQKIAELSRKSQVPNKDLLTLKKSVEEIQKNFDVFDKHSIEVISNRPLIRSVNIRMQLDDWKPISQSTSSSSSSISSIIRQLEFRLKYVRLSGIVTCHQLLVEVNETIGDLIDQFITQCDRTMGINQKHNYYLATEVCQHRVRQRFTNDIQLKTIFNKIDELVLYETPFEMKSTNLQQYCLILCRFQDGLPWDIQFGLPILLNVPRFQCRGRDLIDALDKTLKNCFPLIITNNNIHYEVKLVSDDHQTSTTRILNELADQTIDDHLSVADNATLVVNLVNNDEPTTHLSRVDGTVKSSDKRRKSRK